MNKVLLKDLRSLVHNMLTHDHEQLTALISCDLTRAEIVFYDLDNGSHLLWIVLEFDENWCERSSCSRVDSVYTIFTKLEKHRQELLVDSLQIEQSDVISKVLRKKLLGSPVIASVVKSLQNVLNVFFTFARRHLSQENVQVLDCADSDLSLGVVQELIKNFNEFGISDLRAEQTGNLMD
jgi:hypothetical protein